MAGFKDFTNGVELYAEEIDEYLMGQSVMRFANAATRDSVLNALAVNGMFSYTSDTETLWIYQGGVWKKHTTPWASYTPVWNGPTSLNIGNGSLTGRWRYAGGAIIVKVRLVRGSTTNVGTASYSWSLPVAAADIVPLGFGLYRDVSPFTEYPLTMIGTSSTAVAALVSSGSSRASNAFPVTPATDDVYDFTCVYEPA